VGAILKMGLPSMVGFLAHHIYHLVDTWWISRLPEKEAGVAAVTFLGNIVWFFFTFNQLVGPGSVAVISRRYGEKEYDLAEKAIKETILLKLFFGAIFGISGSFFVADMLPLIGAEGQALEMGIAYGEIIFLGMPIMYATYSIFTALRGVANPNIALFLMLGSNLFNMVLDPIFMFGYLGLPAYGIRGAAIASIISYVITFAIGMYIFYGNHANVKLHLLSKAGISLASMWKIMKIGAPVWLGEMSFVSSRMLIMSMVSQYGTAVVAAYGIGNQITTFGVSVMIGIGLGLSALIGHNIGSGKIERARKIGNQAILLGSGFMTVFGIVVYAFPGVIIGLFFDNPETIELGSRMLRIFAISFPAIGVFLMVEQVHMGVGFNTPAMVVNIISAWLFLVLPIYLLTQVMGVPQTAIWWSMTVAMIVSASMFYLYYIKGRWLTYKV